MKKEKLVELNAVIQICDCGKIDAYKDDGHRCEDYIVRSINRGY